MAESLPDDDREGAAAIEFSGSDPRRGSSECGTGDEVALLRQEPAPQSVSQPIAERSASSKIIEAVLCLIAVAIIWVGASVLVQYIFASMDVKLPFFLTYVCVSEFIVLLPLEWARERWLLRERDLPQTNWRAAARAAAIVCPVWFAAQGTYNWSLAGTSVSSSTVLSTTSCIWTLIFGVVVFRHERLSMTKLVGVALTVTGSALVSYGDAMQDAGGDRTAWADALCLVSAACYGLYTALIKHTVPSDGTVSTAAFFGFLGAFNSLMLLPVVVTLNATGVEQLARVTPAFMGLILIKGLLDNVISDLLWARAIMLSSATMGTVGLSLTIPFAMLADLAVLRKTPGRWLAIGSIGVLAGFLLTTLGTKSDAENSIVAIERPNTNDGGGQSGGSTVVLTPRSNTISADAAESAHR